MSLVSERIQCRGYGATRRGPIDLEGGPSLLASDLVTRQEISQSTLQILAGPPAEPSIRVGVS